MSTKVGELVIIHQCGECGRWEGEQPQAGCCPGCGRRSDPIPYEVAVVRSLESQR